MNFLCKCQFEKVNLCKHKRLLYVLKINNIKTYSHMYRDCGEIVSIGGFKNMDRNRLVKNKCNE